jgi:hypothetical protein
MVARSLPATILVATLLGIGFADRPACPDTQRFTLHEGDPYAEGVYGFAEGAPPPSVTRGVHPVWTAEQGIRAVQGGDIETARAAADAILAEAHSLNGALYFPYDFDWTMPWGKMEAPWYSGMAQGQVLSLLVRLHEQTGDYRSEVEATFRSFQQPRTMLGALPDEYPHDPPDLVLNGAVFGIYGMYDYWRLTGRDAELLAALDELGQTVHRFRGDPSWYDLDHQYRSNYYDGVQRAQLRTLADLTGAECLDAL